MIGHNEPQSPIIRANSCESMGYNLSCRHLRNYISTNKTPERKFSIRLSLDFNSNYASTNAHYAKSVPYTANKAQVQTHTIPHYNK